MYRGRKSLHVGVLDVASLVEECVSTSRLVGLCLIRSHLSTLWYTEWHEAALELTLIAIIWRSCSEHCGCTVSHICAATYRNATEHFTIYVHWSLRLVWVVLSKLGLVYMHLRTTLGSNIEWIDASDWMSGHTRYLRIQWLVFVHNLTYKLVLKFVRLALVDFGFFRVLDLLTCSQRQSALRWLLNLFLGAIDTKLHLLFVDWRWLLLVLMFIF